MKTKTTLSLLAIGGTLVLASGCGKPEKTPPPATSNAPASATASTAETKAAAEAARLAELDKAAETARLAEARLKAEADQAALALKTAEAQRVAEAEKAAAKLAEAEKAAAAEVEAARVAAQKLQADVTQTATAKVGEANTATGSLAQQALSVLQQPGQIESLIASAKNLAGQNKYAEALKIVAELAKLKLSPEQQVMVDQVKQLAEQQLAKATAAKVLDAPQGIPDGSGESK